MDGQTVDLSAVMRDIGQRARVASASLAVTTPEQRIAGLRAAAGALRADAAAILDANARDMAAGQAKGLTPALLDRLRLDDGRLEAIAKGLEEGRARGLLVADPARICATEKGFDFLSDLQSLFL